MSGRLVFGFPGSFPRFTLVALAACLAQVSSVGPALAQSAADALEAPIAPDAPAVAPPAPDPPAPTPTEPGPPNQAPSIAEPTPAATPTPPSQGATPNSGPPAGSAAFAPLPAPTREIAKPQPMPSSPPPEEVRVVPAKAVSRAAYDGEGSKEDENKGGLLGPFRIGVLLGTGLPEVVSFGAQLKLTRFFGAGVNVGLIPTVKIKYYGEAAQKYQEYDVYGHIYPFGGSFFLGTGVGYAQIDGTLVNRFQAAGATIDVTSYATVRTLVLTPQIGFLKIFDVGFAIGVDIGAQIPIAPTEVQFNTVAVGLPQGSSEAEAIIRRDFINPNDEKVRHTLDRVGRTPLPTFNFKIGWFL
ncbi:MAG TPA: hypothetical protein VJV79_37095 [Polyangiaceae bacterium]|nr:hypothetical protein [Polyangiaceae bacterium]